MTDETKPLDQLIDKHTKPRPKYRRTAEIPADPHAFKEQRRIFVRRFITEFLSNQFNATQAYLIARPNASRKRASLTAHEELKEPDVKEELKRQLRTLLDRCELNEEWCYRQWASMANSSVFDYLEFDPTNGSVTKFKLNPDELTPEQQRNIRQIKFSPRTGRLISFKLVDRESSIANVARALKMFVDSERDPGDLQKYITDMMQRASKRVPRVFDHDSGEEVE